MDTRRWDPHPPRGGAVQLGAGAEGWEAARELAAEEDRKVTAAGVREALSPLEAFLEASSGA